MIEKEMVSYALSSPIQSSVFNKARGSQQRIECLTADTSKPGENLSAKSKDGSLAEYTQATARTPL